MQRKKGHFISWFVAFLFSGIFSLHLYAAQSPQSIYTIQVASSTNVGSIHKDFDDLTQRVDEKNLDYLRIEKIGKFYALRLGKFEARNRAAKFLDRIKSQLPSAVVMKAYYKEKRIVRMYERPEKSMQEVMTVQKKPVQEPAPKEVPQEIKPPVREKAEPEADRIKETESVKKQIAAVAGLVDKKDFNRAFEIVKAETAKQPENPELNAWYGTVLLKMDKPAEALKYLKKAVELSPGVSDYHNGAGYCLFFLNRLDKAIHEFNNAVSLDPAHADALAGLGMAYAKSGRKEKAVDVYNRLKEVDGDAAYKLLKIIEGAKL